MMKKRIQTRLPWAAAALILSCAPSAFATYTFTLTGVTPQYSNLGGVYTSPYVADISGIGTGIKVICDDFATDSYIGQSFQATVTQVSSLNGQSTVKWDAGNASQQQQDYATAAYLAEWILSLDQSKPATQYEAELLSFALWAVFDPGALNSLNSTDASGASGYLSTARSNAGSYTQYSNVDIWTPNPQGVSQEFLTVGVDPPGMPEPSSPVLLGIDLLAFSGLVFLIRRRFAGAVRS